jgi:ATP synthase subunit 6
VTPLSQFEIVVLQPLSIVTLDLSLSNFTVYLVFNSFFLLAFVLVPLLKPRFIPSVWQGLVESVYQFLLSIFQSQVQGNRGWAYFPAVFTVFLFILFSNVVGLLPFGFTLTSHFILTLFLALSFNLSFLYLGLFRGPVRFLGLFVPSGVSPALLPLVTVIEVVSYFLRTLSLSIRLFANMMAGHTLLFILSSFVLTALASSALVAMIPLLLVLGVIVLEFGIAFLQSYVFVVLLCIYLNDSYNPGH